MKWISVKDELPEPGVMVLAYFKNECGKDRRIRAMFAEHCTIETSDEDDFFFYDEINDRYYLPQGWYEQNEFEENHWHVYGPVTHWMPLPEAPEGE